MHELGIVFHIVEMVEELGRENRLSSVTAVNLRLGEVSGGTLARVEQALHRALGTAR